MPAQIKAIETVYKGFRFRSRLEARWAVFFDELGVRWEYEHEGFDLDGEWYLPDFWLPEEQAFIEVKAGAGGAKRRPKVYMAGRMIEPTKGQTDLCYRPFNVFSDAAAESKKTLIGPRLIGDVPIVYCGPFTTGSGNHIGVHGDADDFQGREDLCFARSLNGVFAADVVFAMFEDLQAFGTLFEIGFAHALHKRVVIGLSGEVQCWEERAYPLEGREFLTRKMKIRQIGREHDLWFACSAAEAVFSGDRNAVLGMFADWLTKEFPEDREQRLIRKLAAAREGSASIVYGDPVDALSSDSGWFDGGGRSVLLKIRNGHPASYEAALTARQARFEHGQSGAPAR